MRRLINIIITVITVLMVYLSVKLIAGIMRKLQVKERAAAGIEWYKDGMRRLFERIRG